jgi:dimethylaniline monooxygenase (N-oxide forming)
MHHKDFGSSSTLADPKVKHVAVLGGAKSAADIAYAAAIARTRVSWIIRKSGSGPRGLLPARGIGPYQNTNEVPYTRLTASLNPSLWTPQAWAARILHLSMIGRRIVYWIWGISDRNARREADFQERSAHDRTTYQNLQPDTPIFRGNDSSGVNQRRYSRGQGQYDNHAC